MAEPSRYSVSPQQAGLEGGLLKNKLKIKDPKVLGDAETVLLADTYEHFFDIQMRQDLHFNLSLLFKIHHYFLDTLYEWAGKIRSVDISKDGILFCPVIHLQKSFDEFEKTISKHLPSEKDSKKSIARKLAIIHNEFNAIHPFREGNGRAIRLFIDLIASSVGYQPVDYSKSSKTDYLNACLSGIKMSHKPMERIMYYGLLKAR